jgi:hypothetical protein
MRLLTEATLSFTQADITISATSCLGVTIPNADRNTPLATDFLLYVSSENSPSSSFYAKAGACIFGTGNRPIVGAMTWNEAFINADVLATGWGFQLHVRVAMHEMYHALGFSVPQFSNFPGTVLQTVSGRHYFVGSKVKAQVARYFGCADQGMTLATQSDGTAGSHWSEAILGDELMTPSFVLGDQLFLSAFSLALLEDSGFYTVSYDFS